MGVMKDRVPLFNEHAMALVCDMEKLAGKPSVDLTEVLKSNYFNALNGKCFSSLDFKNNTVQQI